MWILILIIFAGEPAMISQEFDSEIACHNALYAAKQIKSHTRPYPDINGICVHK